MHFFLVAPLLALLNVASARTSNVGDNLPVPDTVPSPDQPEPGNNPRPDDQDIRDAPKGPSTNPTGGFRERVDFLSRGIDASINNEKRAGRKPRRSSSDDTSSPDSRPGYVEPSD